MLLAGLERLSVLHAILQRLEDAGDAGAQRLNAADGVRKRLQVDTNADYVRHLSVAAAADVWWCRSPMTSINVRSPMLRSSPPTQSVLYITYLRIACRTNVTFTQVTNITIVEF